MSNEKQDLIPMEITVENLKSRIYIIRGQQVMLDSDLAEIYGYSTKAFNQQVKNNIEKFEDDFRFQLTPEEVNNLRSNFLTTNISSKSRYEPYVFTESGIYMLMTVLKGELAIRQSKTLIRMFKQMKDYINYNFLPYNNTNISGLLNQITEYPNIKVSFRHTGGKFHDRYIIIDYKNKSEKIYHCGASSKDAGNKITTISKSDNNKLYYPMIEELLLQPKLNLK